MPDTYELLNYYTEAMTVPFYAGEGGKSLSLIMDKWDMKPSVYLGPMTEVMAEQKPQKQQYIVALIGSGGYKGQWGMIWSGHLRQARHRNEKVLQQTLTGASYGFTKDKLENSAAIQNPSPWRLLSKVLPDPDGPTCLRCGSPMRDHKIYESEEARDLLAAVLKCEHTKNPKGPGKCMLGLMMVFNSAGSLAGVIGGESGWKAALYQNAFETVMNQKGYGKISMWANKALGFGKDVHTNGLADSALLRDWKGGTVSMKQSGDTMQCAGPKVVQAYLQWDADGRNKRSTDTVFMSEIWAGQKPADQVEEGVAIYEMRNSASSCSRCRAVIPTMLCGKAPTFQKTELPQLIYEVTHSTTGGNSGPNLGKME